MGRFQEDEEQLAQGLGWYLVHSRPVQLEGRQQRAMSELLSKGT